MADGDNIEIVVKDKTFHISKKLLSSSSDFFKAMFNNNFKESLQNSLELKDVDPLAFQLIVEHVQFGTLKMIESVESAVYALQCASFLQFCEVQKKCEAYITQNLTRENSLSVYKVASQLYLKKLADSAMTCAAWHCQYLLESDYFLEDPVDVCKFLRTPGLNIHDGKEWNLWNFICKWIEENEEERKQYLLNLLTCIDYSLLQLSDIYDMTFYPLVSEDVKVSEFLSLMKKIYKEHKFSIDIDYFLECNSNICEEEVRLALKSVFRDPVKRTYPGVPWLTVCETFEDNGRRKRNFTPVILYYDWKSNNVYELVRLSKFAISPNWQLCVGFRVHSVGYRLYIFGGQYHIGSNVWNEDVWSYNTVTKNWEAHEKLPERRRNHMVCVVDSVIYLIGGYGKHRISLSSMDAYDTKTEKWLKTLPKIPFNGTGACCAFNGDILVFAENFIHTFQVKSKKWFSERLHSVGSAKPLSYGCAAAVVHANTVYLLRSFSNEVYKINPNEEDKKIEYFGSFKNNTENICVLNDALFSFSIEDRIERNDKETVDEIENYPEKTVNVIEVIPLSTESYKKYENLSIVMKSSQNSMDSSLSSHNCQELEENLETNLHHKSSFQVDTSKYAKGGSSHNNVYPSVEQDQIQKQEDSTLPSSQDREILPLDIKQSENLSHHVQQNPQQSVEPRQLVPLQGIKIWDSEIFEWELSNLSFWTGGSSSHGCSTLFKISDS